MGYLLCSVFAEGFGRNAVGLLKELVKIGYGGKAYIVAHRQDSVVCILKLKCGLLQTDPVQVLGHGVAGVLPEAAA